MHEFLLMKNKLSHIDTSKLPFNIKLDVVKRRNIPDHLLPPIVTAFCLKLSAYVPSIKDGKYIELFSYTAINDYDNIEYQAFYHAQCYCNHEVAENFKYNNELLFNAHDNEFELSSKILRGIESAYGKFIKWE